MFRAVAISLALLSFSRASVTHLVAAEAITQIDDPKERLQRLGKEKIIPAFVEYEPPSQFERFDTRQTGFIHATSGWFGSIGFRIVPVGMVLESNKKVRSVSLTWVDLGKIFKDITPASWVKPEFKEITIDGKRVLLLDYEWEDKRGGSVTPKYFSRCWIPIEKDIVLEASIQASTTDLRDELKQTLTAMRIKKYESLK